MADSRKYPCKSCHQFFLIKKEKEDHFEEVHFKIFACEESDNCIAEIFTMADSRKYPCKSCPRVFSSERELGCHLEIHSGTLTCRLGCDRNFSSTTEMEKHLKLVHFDIWTCDGCGKDFYKELDWVVHTMKVHLTMKNDPNKDHIEVHLPKNVLSNNHATVNEIIINLTCEYCDKNFNTIDDLKKHKDVVHLKEKSYECVKCKKTFSSEKYLRAHTDVVHTKKKKFKCERCQKSYVYQSYLAKHVERHIARNRRLKYKCEECNNRFIVIDSLKRHLEKQHSKLQEYICQKHCGRFFATKDALMQHCAEVANPKYRCKECESAFDKKYKLSIHVRENHKNTKRSK